MRSSASLLIGLASLAVGTFPASALAADNDDSFNTHVGQYRGKSVNVDEWQNQLMPSGTGRYARQSADEVLTATLRVYTREVLDRGYWVNQWVGDAVGYSWGNPLLAVAQGSGVTLSVATLTAGAVSSNEMAGRANLSLQVARLR